MVIQPKQEGPFDAIIIGAGVIGASVGLGLSRRGLKTLNIDALPASGYGSTSNSSAVIRPFYSAIESCALPHEARHRWANWQEFVAAPDERGFAKFTECGMLILLGEGDEGRFQHSINAMSQVGVAFERLTASQVKERHPIFNMDSFGPPKPRDAPNFGISNGSVLAGGIYIRQAGFVNDPQLAAHNLQKAAEAMGAKFKFNKKVITIKRSGGRVIGVTTEKGEDIVAPIVVNVAGPHSFKINMLAGVVDEMSMSTRPMRHEVAHVTAPTGYADAQSACVVGDGDAGVYFRPEMGDHMLIGSLDPECDLKDYVDADDYNADFTEQWTNQVWRTAQRIPSLGIPNTAQGVVGLYDATPDWVPIYDKSSLPGYYMAIGTSGNQFKNAPIVGDVMAELITACEAGHNHDEDPVSFHLPILNRAINLGFFSRNRALHSDGSGTVLA